MYMRTLIAVSAMAVISTTAHAGAELWTVKLSANDFPATQAMSAAVTKCDGGSADISVNLNKDHKDLIVPAFTANPPEFTVSHVTNSTLVSVMNDGLAMPPDDLVAAHGGSIQDMQKVTIDGKVMAIAFMANAQHLFYRKMSWTLQVLACRPPMKRFCLLQKRSRIKVLWNTHWAAHTKPAGTLVRNSSTCISGMAAHFLRQVLPKRR